MTEIFVRRGPVQDIQFSMIDLEYLPYNVDSRIRIHRNDLRLALPRQIDLYRSSIVLKSSCSQKINNCKCVNTIQIIECDRLRTIPGSIVNIKLCYCLSSGGTSFISVIDKNTVSFICSASQIGIQIPRF